MEFRLADIPLTNTFPDGKEELAAEALNCAGQTLVERIRTGLAVSDDAAEAIETFVGNIAHYIEVSQFRSGGPVMTVAMETATTNARLNRACRDAYDRLQSAFESKLVESGFAPSPAKELAMFIAASIEGGVVLSRTYHSGDPLRRIARLLGQVLRTANRS